jgi:23S rRNA pseudouridine1911/1915/1917 synthase
MSEKDLKIIYEDDDVLAIDKPAGINTHPAPGDHEKALSEIVAEYLNDHDKSGKDLVVHRLDKGTSGVIIFAKNKKARENLQKQFASRTTEKKYFALVSGHLDSEEGKIDIPLGRNTASRGRFDPKAAGKPAVTYFTVIHQYRDFDYVEARPKTGRTHQIRTHFSAIGHPVAGDERYGYHGQGFPRIFLHAASLSFSLPASGERTEIKSTLPAELQNILDQLPD